MTITAMLFMLLGLGLIAWLTGRARAIALAGNGKSRLNSLPNYHGWYVLAWVIIPAAIFTLVWQNISPVLITNNVLASPDAVSLPSDAGARAAILSEARNIANGVQDVAFQDGSEKLVDDYRQATSLYNLIQLIILGIIIFACGAFAFLRIKPDFRARSKVERLMLGVLLAASLIAIITTLGIVASLMFETFQFFTHVSVSEFIFGTEWNPKKHTTPGEYNGYGAIPLFWGTIFIGAIIAMIVAIPLGLMSAIYLTQYASTKLRAWMKPILELLAGIPTVVYGYFAALTIAPAVRDFAVMLGVSNAASDNAMAAGLVMGVMIIPLVASMSDDSIAAVPSAMRDGSLAMGATKSETIKKVLLPAALPGVVGGILLAVSRAIGETMIVVMAAGYTANLTANPFASITTVTVQIVALLTGDQDFGSPQTLAAFALGLLLFCVTLMLNLIALRIVKKYREEYE
ncbi:phosphate ABC transporter permease subunit PstC [Sphingorhabdus lutea]|uniref:Phosphate transport system permease protein n=1 Tax=Sphingorhabdus lutea TaxID=1913578 RepID=A0A1L3JAR6_9SPHN|nr:phosphate ABC transporter permease subunit PstC [Sphingorhabdus lutea]APG62209.1 phosphate ABC transporter permease subunit PstC [Sphingorhabdus lutea]